MPSSLDPNITVGEQRFLEEWIKDGSTWGAAVRAGIAQRDPRHVDYNAHNRLPTDPRCQPYLERLRRQHVARVMAEPAAVLHEMWTLATADPSELTRVTRKACRHCYGVNFAYQWKGEWEYAADLARAAHELERWHNTPAGLRGLQPKLPDYPSDGRWYDWRLDPHPDCPHCEGRGEEIAEIADMRRVSPAARRLIAGIKPTAAGIEVKMRDQDAALRAVAAAIGMITEGHGISTPGASQALTREQLVAMCSVEELEVLERLSRRAMLGYDATPSAPATSASGEHKNAVASEGERAGPLTDAT